MALMPPRRSTRLSAHDYGSGGSSSPLAYAKVSGSAGPSRTTIGDDDRKRRSAETTSLSRSKPTSSSSTGRRERRFEEIQSEDDEDADDADFMTGFARPVISGNAKHAASIPIPRAPRATFHEEAGDDGFIFSAAASQSATTDEQQGKRKSSTAIAGSRGRPPRSSVAQHALISARQSFHPTAESVTERRENVKGSTATTPPSANAMITSGGRISSSAVKAVRRTSLLRDGTTAHPHPVIADGDLHRHCSSEMDKKERLRHMANWTLNRSTKKLLGRFEGTLDAQRTLQSVLQSTLQDLSSGKIDLVWPGLKAAGPSQHKRPHPRNEANRRTERTLLETVKSMRDEVERWQRCKEDIQKYQAETEEMEDRAAAEMRETASTDAEQLRALFEEMNGDTEMQIAREALMHEAPWFGEVDGQAEDDAICSLAKDLYAEAYEQPVPHAKAVKRRRTTLSAEVGGTANSQTADLPTILQGTQADSRWQDVEWHADLLRSRTHRIVQFAQLADRYTAAISARGAQAIDEMINGIVGKDATQTTTTTKPSSTSSSTSSHVSRQGQQTLQRILAGIRTVQSGVEIDSDVVRGGGQGDSAAAAHAVPGDVSEGDILRAFAGLSGRTR